MEEISAEAGELVQDPEFTFWGPESWNEVVKKLNGGLYQRLLERFHE